MTYPLLNIYEDFERLLQVEKRASGATAYSAATGETWAARLAATRSGSAIGSCTCTVAEVGSTGYYKATLDTATLVADLATYVGRIVWLIWSKSGDVDRRWVAFRVVSDAEVGDT